MATLDGKLFFLLDAVIRPRFLADAHILPYFKADANIVKYGEKTGFALSNATKRKVWAKSFSANSHVLGDMRADSFISYYLRANADIFRTMQPAPFKADAIKLLHVESSFTADREIQLALRADAIIAGSFGPFKFVDCLHWI